MSHISEPGSAVAAWPIGDAPPIPGHRPAALAIVAVLVVALSLLVGGAAHAQGTSDPNAGTLCGLLTTDEVSAAVGGEPMSVSDGSASDSTCMYIGDINAGSATNLYASLTKDSGGASLSLIDQVRGTYADAVDVHIDGYQALLSKSQIDVFPDPLTWLSLRMSAPTGVDVATALQTLAGLAVARLLASTAPVTTTSQPSPSVAGGG